MAYLSGLYSIAELHKLVGKRAAERRLARGISQASLARSAGVSVSTLARFEKGGDVAFDVVIRVAAALEADDALTSLFPLPNLTSLDDLLEPPRRRRAPRSPRPSA
ncbi:MAG: helix-turn-helix transcriptional regulator [Candidatus Velthaea sp.]|jgi:transcriptional regulator with XRE-family HTH domain